MCGEKLAGPGMPCPKCKPTTSSVYDDFSDKGVIDSEDLYEEMTNVEIKTRPAWVRVLAVVGAALFIPAAVLNYTQGSVTSALAELAGGLAFFFLTPYAWKAGCHFRRWGLPRKQYSGNLPYYYNMYIWHWTIGPLIYTIGGLFCLLAWLASLPGNSGQSDCSVFAVVVKVLEFLFRHNRHYYY
jgi:hypothetical protein